MDYETIRRTVNELVDMLIDRGMVEDEILDRLDLDNYGIAYFDLRWLTKECVNDD